METNFFSQLYDLKLTGNTRLNIQILEDGTMAVSLLLINDYIKDKSANQIPPLLLKGSIRELDSKFFETITNPIQKTSQLLCNMREHEQALKNAQASNSPKTNSGTGNKEKDAKRKRFEEQFKKVNDLEKLNRIGEAIGQMPDIKLYPEFEEEIKTKMQQLRAKHGTLSLFEDQPEKPSENPATDLTEHNTDEDPKEVHPDDSDLDEEDDPAVFDEYDPNR